METTDKEVDWWAEVRNILCQWYGTELLDLDTQGALEKLIGILENEDIQAARLAKEIEGFLPKPRTVPGAAAVGVFDAVCITNITINIFKDPNLKGLLDLDGGDRGNQENLKNLIQNLQEACPAGTAPGEDIAEVRKLIKSIALMTKGGKAHGTAFLAKVDSLTVHRHQLSTFTHIRQNIVRGPGNARLTLKEVARVEFLPEESKIEEQKEAQQQPKMDGDTWQSLPNWPTVMSGPRHF